MELIIILLIAVEVIIVCFSFLRGNIRLISLLQCLIRDGPELWDMLFHSRNEDHGKIVEIKDEPSPSVVTKAT